MGKKFLLTLTMTLLMLCTFVSPTQAAAVEAMTLRIGLAYSTTALSGANLLNKEGSGYRFGYLNDDGDFQQLGLTSETAISMVKTQNTYYGTVSQWSGYYTSITSDIAVGCWHIQTSGSYATFAEAQAAASSYTGGFPAYINGVYYVRIGAYTSSANATAAQTNLGLTSDNSSIVGTSSYGISVVKTGTSTVLFQYDSSTAPSFVVAPHTDDTVKSVTYFRGYSYYGYFQYTRLDGGDLTVVNLVDMEDYVDCVISREMSDSWPLEALKAQAICARTYAAMNLNRHSTYGFDLCSGTHCQAYYGTSSTGSNTAQAAEETAGQYVWYGTSLATTFYSACNGGASESVGNVWNDDGTMPYLVGKEDPYEAAVVDKISSYEATTTYTKTQLRALLQSNNYDCGEVIDFRVTAVTDVGNVLTVSVFDANGNQFDFSKEQARIFFGFRSQRYSISGGSATYVVDDGDTLSTFSGVYAIDGTGAVSQVASSSMPYVITEDGVSQLATPTVSGDTFTITTWGWGHHVGMSQWGAYSMAQSGYDYEDILTFYFTGVTVGTQP